MTSTIGLEGALTAPDTSSGSVDQTGFDLYHILNTSTDPFSATINGVGEVFDSIGFDPAGSIIATDVIQGMGSWTASFNGKYPSGVSKSGHEGLTTFAAGYVKKSTSWSVSLNCTKHDDTGHSEPSPEWYESIPGLLSGTGTFDCAVDDTTPITRNTAGPATFRFNNETGTDNTIAGNIIITGWVITVDAGGRNVIRYSFKINGNMTSAGDRSFLPAGLMAKPDITEIVLRAGGSRDYTGSCFWTSLSIGASIGSPIEVSGSLQGTGELVVG